MAHKDCECACFACMVGKNPKTLKLSPMANDAITRGGIGNLVSLVYLCSHRKYGGLVLSLEKESGLWTAYRVQIGNPFGHMAQNMFKPNLKTWQCLLCLQSYQYLEHN